MVGARLASGGAQGDVASDGPAVMARYYLLRPGINYRTRFSRIDVFAGPGNSGVAADVFDTNDPRRDCPTPFVPPVLGLKPGDAEAQAALTEARAPYAGKVLPGLGFVPIDEPIWSP